MKFGRGRHGATAGGWGRMVAMTGLTLYCACMLCQPLSIMPERLASLQVGSKLALLNAIGAAFTRLGSEQPSREWTLGLYFVLVSLVIPWFLAFLAGRGRPADLGFRRPNRIGWRAIVVGVAVSFPLLWWMAHGPRFAGMYVPHLRRVGAPAFLGFYAVNMFTEHFFFHGVLLAFGRSSLRWPTPAPIATGRTTRGLRFLRWLGLAQPSSSGTPGRRIRRWLGLRRGCVTAIVWSAILFALAHVGKDYRELLLSAPGGAAQAYLAYRTNSLFVPMLLHFITAATALSIVLIGA